MSDYLKAIRHWLDDPGLVRNLGKPLIQSTEKLATQLVSGAINHIWVVDIGSTGFGRELTNRAGGLAAIKLLDRPEQLTARDLVIAADHGLDVNDQLDCYQKVLDSGASLVLMGSSHSSVSQGVRATVFLDNLLGQSPSYGFEDRFCPRDTTLNSILAWCFLAELVSACVREGQMPVMYGSAFQAGGADRAGLYARDGLFHNPGDFNVYPLGAGVCCQLFMGQLRNSLDRIMETQMPLMAEVVQWYQESLDKGGELWLGVESHLLAQQVKGNGNPGFFQYLEEPLSDNNLGQYLLAPNVYTHLGYFTYPSVPLFFVNKAGVKSVWFQGDSANSPIPLKPGRVVIDQMWEAGDAVINLPGYDIRIIPISGIIQNTLFWELNGQLFCACN